MIPIINIYLNKHPMSWEIIHLRLVHPSDSFMEAIFHHKIITGGPKHLPEKTNQSLCTICHTLNMTTLQKGTTIETTNLKQL